MYLLAPYHDITQLMSIYFTVAASLNLLCMVFDGEVVPLLRRTSNLEDYPIYRDLSVLQTDVISTNNSPYPVSIE